MNPFSRARVAPIFFVAVALALSACAAPAPTNWPGVASNGQLALVAFNQQVHAINLADGKQSWAFPAAVSNTTGGFHADPGVSADIVVVGSDGPGATYSGVLYGLDPATGGQRWCLAFDTKGADRQKCPLALGSAATGLFGIATPTDNRIIGGILLDGNTAYFGLASGWVHAVNAANGEVLWSYRAGESVWAEPSLGDGTLFVGGLDHNLYALNSDNGALRWKQDLGSAIGATPVFTAGRVFVGTFGNQLRALSAADGAELWKIDTANWIWGSPLPDGENVIYADLSGKVAAVDAQTGAERWNATPGGPVRASPIRRGNALYVSDKAGALFALDPASGAVLWRQTMKGQLLANLLVTDSQVLVAPYQGDNLLQAYTTAGAAQWVFAPSK